jgi:NAD(P)H-nitrite reductase large subunit
MHDDDEVCYCFHVRKRKILNFLRVRQPKRVSQLSECGGAGTGCGWCIPYLKKFFLAWQQQAPDPDAEVVAADYAAGREAYIRAGKGKPPAGSSPGSAAGMPGS